MPSFSPSSFEVGLATRPRTRMIETPATREIALLGVERVGLGAKATGGASGSAGEELAENWDEQGAEDKLGTPTWLR